MNFRTLKANEIDVRIGSVSQKGATLLLYKDARCDMAILDETVGSMNWQRHHLRENANCIVSIWDGVKGEWIEKEDTGTESFTEKEKGLASDSFKRACFNWGIGRELYTAPRIFIKCATKSKSGGRGYELENPFEFYGLEVTEIDYTDRVISRLAIAKDGREIYSYGNGNTKATRTKTKEQADSVEKAQEEAQGEITEGMLRTLSEMISETETDVNELLKYYDVDSLKSLTKEQYGNALKLLVAKKNKAAKAGKVIGAE